MRAFSYLLYLLFWETLCFGGCAWLVFFKGHSGWWFLAAVYLSGQCFKPRHWRQLWEKGEDWERGQE